jgi:hypothetical protein
MHRRLADVVNNCVRYVLVLERPLWSSLACCYDETAIGTHSRHPTMGRLVFDPSERPRGLTSRTAGIGSRAPRASAIWRVLSPGQHPFPWCRVLHSDRSTRRTNRGRETMRDDPWTAANRDKEQPKVTIAPTRNRTAETASPPSKRTVSGPFWTGKTSAPDVPNPQRVIAARQRTED